LDVAALVRGGVSERRPQADSQKPRDRGNHFDAPEVQAIGAFQLPDEPALDVKERGHNAGDRLSMQRLETARRGQLVPDWRSRFPQNIPLEGGVFEGAGGGQTAGSGPVYSGFD